LPPDAVTPHVRQDGPEPVVEHPRLELEPDPEPDRLVAHPRDERERVVARHEPAFEEVDFTPRAEDLVVQLDRLRQEFLVGDNDVGVGHEIAF
jgi:hypothetical protein